MLCCCSVGETQKKAKTVSEKKSHDDMLVIYSPTAGLYINIDLLRCLQVIQGLAV